MQIRRSRDDDCRHLCFTGKEMVDYIADYLENIRNRRVLPNVSPGYMRHLVPESAPVRGEDWNVIINDVERVIMPGVCLISSGAMFQHQKQELAATLECNRTLGNSNSVVLSYVW